MGVRRMSDGISWRSVPLFLCGPGSCVFFRQRVVFALREGDKSFSVQVMINSMSLMYEIRVDKCTVVGRTGLEPATSSL